MVPLGQRLYRERIRRKVTLADAAAATKIKEQFLVAIEKGEYTKLPSPAYAQGFVRNYAVYLGFPKADITALFKREFDEKRAYKVLPDSLVKTEEFPLKRLRIHQSLLVAGGVLLLFLGYLLFQYRYVFIPPSLTVFSPKDGSVTSQDVTVTGQTDSNATVSVNNESVFLASDGKFTKKITLFPGETILTIKAKNRLGKETVVTKEIQVK